jgi:hypothetical protein
MDVLLGDANESRPGFAFAYSSSSRKRVVSGRRLDTGNVEARAADATGLQRPGQGRFVHQPATGRVDHERLALHQGELLAADHVPRLRRQQSLHCS